VNIHISKELKDEWPQYEFKGKPFVVNGKMYIKAKHKVLNQVHFYSFEERFFWFDRPIKL